MLPTALGSASRGMLARTSVVAALASPSPVWVSKAARILGKGERKRSIIFGEPCPSLGVLTSHETETAGQTLFRLPFHHFGVANKHPSWKRTHNGESIGNRPQTGHYANCRRVSSDTSHR